MLARLKHSEQIKLGDVAQLGERKHGMFQVAGSIPVISTKSLLLSSESFIGPECCRRLKNPRIRFFVARRAVFELNWKLRRRLSVRRSLLCVVSLILMLVSEGAFAKEMANRLGVGFRDSYTSMDLPSLSAQYYPNSQYGLIGAIGIDTEDNRSRFGFSGGIRKIIFMEENLNFFMGGLLSVISRETAGSTDSGFELAATVGSEFFLAGLENLGFNLESGLAFSNVGKVRFRTMGDSFLRSGIIFYF